MDSNIYDGYTIPSTYDSMIAKLIVHGNNRQGAINKMKRALGEFLIDGIKTNIDYHMGILNNKKFISGNYDTGFIGRDHK